MATKTVYTNKDAVMGKQTSGGSFSGWNGKDDHLQVGATGSYKWRSCIYFPISFSGMTAINSAVLHLTNHFDSAGGNHQPQLNPPSTLLVRRMTADWGEGDSNPGEGNLTSTETWDWDNRADKHTASGGASKSITQSGSEETITITDIVRAWFNGSNNYGVLLINDTSESSTSKSLLFRSRQHSSDARAHVVIDYDTNQPPNAPTAMTPTGGQVVHSMNPTFSLTGSDPDSGDFITAYQLAVYNNAETVEMYNTGKINVSGFPSSVSHVYGSASSPTTSPLPLVEGQTYKWRAYTFDKAGDSGPLSAMQAFIPNAPPAAPTVTLISSPVGDINDDTPSFSISHNDVGNANMNGYQFIVANSPDGSTAFDSGPIDISGAPIPVTTVTSGPLAFGTSYQIKARTQDNQNIWGAYSSWVQFTLHKAQAPTNFTPTGNENTNTTPYLSGERGSSQDVIIAYWLRVYTDDESATPLPATRYTTGITSGGIGFSLLYAGSALSASTYYKWQAMVETSVGDSSVWSALSRFFVSDPSTPSLTSPATTLIGTLTPTFTGQRATTFNRFQYELYAANGTTLLYASASLSSTITGSGPYVFTSVYGGAPALTWATQYKWRARVSSDAGANWSAWSGQVAFTTSSAGSPVLNSPTVDQWITTATPAFTIDRTGADTIDRYQVIVYNASQQQIWDSGMIDVTNGTINVGGITYSGPTLTGGDYYWSARYQITTGPTGPYSTLRKFRLNRPPSIPADLFPTPNYVFGDTLLPSFQATFQDPDKDTNNDSPNGWDIDIMNSSGTVLATKTITTALSSGVNSYQWVGGDYTLTYGVQYMWRTRFRDSKSLWGAYSASTNFKCATAPNGTITTPSDGSSVAAVNPTINWSYSGGTQSQYSIRVNDAVSGSIVYDISPPIPSAATSHQINFLKNNKTYTVTLTVWNTDGLKDPTPSVVSITAVLDAPDPISGLSATTFDRDSYIQLDWSDPGSLKSGHSFVRYQIYRRVIGDVEWYELGETRSKSTPRYIDYFVGNSIRYEYRVTQVDTKAGAGIELESPDGDENIIPASLLADVWMFVGFDRSPEHIVELPVSDESHTRPVQQEEFEPLGSDRKVIMRGFVLGHEGSVQCIWINRDAPSPGDQQVYYNETIIGRRLVDYLTRNKGPHILKSPFGDVWNVEFQGPSYKWLDTGNLQVDLAWIETGETSGVVV